MAKLIDILKEIKVVQPLNKRKVFEDMLNFDEYTLCLIIQFDTLEDLIINNDVNSLQELIGEFYNDYPTKYTTLISNYYNAIKPGDITLIGSDLTSIADYKNAIVLTDSYEEKYFIATKF
jgi:hypothetical protein